MAAAEISEVDYLLSDLGGNPEEIILRQRPRQRLAHYAAKLVQSASDTAKTVLRELMVGTNGDRKSGWPAWGCRPSRSTAHEPSCARSDSPQCAR